MQYYTREISEATLPHKRKEKCSIFRHHQKLYCWPLFQNSNMNFKWLMYIYIFFFHFSSQRFSVNHNKHSTFWLSNQTSNTYSCALNKCFVTHLIYSSFTTETNIKYTAIFNCHKKELLEGSETLPLGCTDIIKDIIIIHI